MWIFTESGFVSVVSEVSREPLLTVRSREKKSLTGVARAVHAAIVETPMADYPYRIYVAREHLASHVETAISSLDYPNFKDRAAIKRGRTFSEALHAVWVAMLAVEDRPRYLDR